MEEPLRIFISYRRLDARGYAGWLSYCLEPRYGGRNIFRDVETIDPGIPWKRAIEDALRQCHVALCLIGDQWLSVVGSTGSRRLDDPDDPVRFEVGLALALKAPQDRLIPVLLDGARMPSQGELPDELKLLPALNAFPLSDARWREDFARLMVRLDAIQAAETTKRGGRSKLSGAEILRRLQEGTQPPRWIGRKGGRRGLLEDVTAVAWRDRDYEVKFDGARGNDNWFSAEEFLAVVNEDRDET